MNTITDTALCVLMFVAMVILVIAITPEKQRPPVVQAVEPKSSKPTKPTTKTKPCNEWKLVDAKQDLWVRTWCPFEE